MASERCRALSPKAAPEPKALFGGEDTATEPKACARAECNDDKDDNDDDRDDDDDNEHGHGFYPIALYVETQVANGL